MPLRAPPRLRHSAIPSTCIHCRTCIMLRCNVARRTSSSCRAARDAAGCSAESHVACLARRAANAAFTTAVALSMLAPGASARLEAVDRPELLPKEKTPVVDVADFLAPSEERQLRSEIEKLERDTGFKLRVLAQNYPETPGKAIQRFWKIDTKTIVFVADPTFGDILNFNVGREVDTQVPQQFWPRLSGSLGSKFYWQQRGEADTIMDAVKAIDLCLREPDNKSRCGAGHLRDKVAPGELEFFGD